MQQLTLYVWLLLLHRVCAAKLRARADASATVLYKLYKLYSRVWCGAALHGVWGGRLRVGRLPGWRPFRAAGAVRRQPWAAEGGPPPQRRAWSVTVAVTMVGMAVAALLPAQAAQLQC